MIPKNIEMIGMFQASDFFPVSFWNRDIVGPTVQMSRATTRFRVGSIWMLAGLQSVGAQQQAPLARPLAPVIEFISRG